MRTLRNLLATVLLAAGAFLSAPAQISFAPNPQLPLPQGIHFYMNPGVDYDGRFGYMCPTWWIFPDGPCDQAAAEALVDELGLNGPLKDYVGMIAVMSPSNGKAYDKAEDV